MELKDILIDQSKLPARKQNPFKVLVKNASENQANEDFDTLFRTFFTQESLYFISPVREDWQNAVPFIGQIQEQPCIFTFTDLAIAFDFCMKHQEFKWENDQAFIMHLPIDECIGMFKDLAGKGVFGIRINEGSSGFFIPMSHLEGIIEHLTPTSKEEK